MLINPHLRTALNDQSSLATELNNCHRLATKPELLFSVQRLETAGQAEM